MLDLFSLASWARLRATTRVHDKSKERGDVARMYIAQNQLFCERLIDACKRVPDEPIGVPDVTFIAVPERLFGKIAYLSVGTSRTGKERPEKPENISVEAVKLLCAYDEIQKGAKFKDLDSTRKFQTHKDILVCHGLSPIGDSILLLADLGRSLRLSWALGFPLRIMLADISWMNSNRSIRQFKTLSEKDIDTGLRVCLDKRRRLYEAIRAECDLHEIAPYDRTGAISRKKLIQISDRYTALARAIWGCSGRLEHNNISLISRSLDQAMFRGNSTLPDHITIIGQFPRALNALENELKPHLEIIRIIAKQFNTLDEDVFTYFFAQYYAQYSYRGNAIKVAPISEVRFDEPFDLLDKYFQAWGEGQSTTDIITGQAVEKDNDPLSAIYSPQYNIGKNELLPYNPLSLDALRLTERGHHEVVESMVSLDNDLNKDLVVEKLKETFIVQRNRLISDILSFIQHCNRLWGVEVLNEHAKHAGLDSWTSTLNDFPELLANSYDQEMSVLETSNIQEMWRTWLRTIEVEESPKYIPAHLYFYLCDASDWSDSLFNCAAKLVLLASYIYKSVI